MKSKGTFGIIIALSIAMVGAATLTSLNLAQDAFAETKNCSGEPGKNCWCYNSEISNPCFTSKGDCNQAQKSDVRSRSGCYKFSQP